MSFPAYPSYRESGVEWLEAVPSGWLVSSVKRVIQFQTGWTPPTGRNDLYGSGNTWVTIGDLNGRTVHDSSKQVTDEAVQLVGISPSPKGSLLFSFKLSIGQVAFASKDLYTNEAIATFLPSPDVDLAFAYYAFPEFIMRNAGENIYGARLLNQELIREAKLAIPPRPEQASIAAFLDRETAKIDALVNEQRRLIELLREKRQAVISHAVTKGLDPNVSMKDSGVEWLGEVPAHWEVKPLKYLTPPDRAIMYGIVLPGPDAGSGIAIVKGGDVKEHRLSLSTLCYTTPEIEAPYARARLRADDIVYSIRGSIGDAELVPEELLDANITQDVARISPIDEVNPHWLLQVMRSKPVFVQLEQRSLGAAVRGINIFDLKRAYIPVPPREEQDAIAAEMTAQLNRLSQLEKAAAKSIALMQEHRAALIAAAVTGKIDVRGSATTEPDAEAA